MKWVDKIKIKKKQTFHYNGTATISMVDLFKKSAPPKNPIAISLNQSVLFTPVSCFYEAGCNFDSLKKKLTTKSYQHYNSDKNIVDVYSELNKVSTIWLYHEGNNHQYNLPSNRGVIVIEYSSNFSSNSPIQVFVNGVRKKQLTGGVGKAVIHINEGDVENCIITIKGVTDLRDWCSIAFSSYSAKFKKPVENICVVTEGE